MNLLTIKKGDTKIDIRLDGKKVVFGSDYETKNQIKKNLQLYFGGKTSEYRKEEGIVAEVLLDGRPIGAKTTLFYVVNDSYSIIDDSKLQTSSLITKYFMSLLQENEYFDTINTLNFLLESLNDEISEDSLFSPIFNQLTDKQLVKLMNPLLVGEYGKDEFDLSSQELIILQLKMLNYIVDKSKSIEKVILIVEVWRLNEEIIGLIDSFDRRVSVLVFVNEVSLKIKPKDALIIEQNKIIDLSDIESLYFEISNKSEALFTLMEVEDMINKFYKSLFVNEEDIVDRISRFLK